MADQTNYFSQAICDIVSSSSDQKILGVHLGIQLKKRCPDFSPAALQCRNLRQFIARHIPAISEVGQSGSDVIYQYTNRQSIEEAKPSAPEQLPVDDSIWRAYTNPAQPYTIHANVETGEVRVVGRNEHAQTPWTEITKCSPAVHHELATEYVSTLTEPQSLR